MFQMVSQQLYLLAKSVSSPSTQRRPATVTSPAVSVATLEVTSTLTSLTMATVLSAWCILHACLAPTRSTLNSVVYPYPRDSSLNRYVFPEGFSLLVLITEFVSVRPSSCENTAWDATIPLNVSRMMILLFQLCTMCRYFVIVQRVSFFSYVFIVMYFLFTVEISTKISFSFSPAYTTYHISLLGGQALIWWIEQHVFCVMCLMLCVLPSSEVCG